MTVHTMSITGVAAGVPFVALSPQTPRSSAPVVVAWHLLDPPRTEDAMAAALPLDGLDAWRVYFGLPMCGGRTPAGGPEELMRLAMEDAVVNVQGPIVTQAAAEFPAAFAELGVRFGFGPEPHATGPVGLVGGSLGSAVAQLVLAEGDVAIAAAVLVSPIVQLRASVDCTARSFGFDYAWGERAEEYARRLDFLARAAELSEVDLLLLVGADDDAAGHREPAERLAALRDGCGGSGRATLEIVPGMAHALAEEPGEAGAAQGPAAADVDRRAVRWLSRRLGL